MPVIDEGDQSVLNINLVNKLTGEVFQQEIISAEQAKNLYIELTANAAVIKKAQDSLKSYLENFLGNDKEYRFIDGKLLRKVERVTMIYRPQIVKESLQSALDKDTFNAVWESINKIDQKTLDGLVGEMQERGELPGGTLKYIREQADMKAQNPFVEVR